MEYTVPLIQPPLGLDFDRDFESSLNDNEYVHCPMLTSILLNVVTRVPVLPNLDKWCRCKEG